MTISALMRIVANVDAIEAMKTTGNWASDLSIRTLGEGAFARLQDGTRE